jgi:hypothetical protein
MGFYQPKNWSQESKNFTKKAGHLKGVVSLDNYFFKDLSKKPCSSSYKSANRLKKISSQSLDKLCGSNILTGLAKKYTAFPGTSPSICNRLASGFICK